MRMWWWMWLLSGACAIGFGMGMRVEGTVPAWGWQWWLLVAVTAVGLAMSAYAYPRGPGVLDRLTSRYLGVVLAIGACLLMLGLVEFKEYPRGLWWPDMALVLGAGLWMWFEPMKVRQWSQA